MEFVASGYPRAIKKLSFFLNPSIGSSYQISFASFLVDIAVSMESNFSEV